MTTMERVAREQAFHDDQARQRAELFHREPSRLVFSDDEYLDHESWIRPAWLQLEGVCGKRVLDYGCGHGMAAVVLARSGAEVSAFDLSGEYVAEANHRANANGVRIHAIQADGHALPFADQSFDAIWGNAILHHLDLAAAIREMHRVLKPGGRAVFCEPWGGNPLLRLVRRKHGSQGAHRTDDEEPLRQRDLSIIRQAFPNMKWHGFQLLGMVRRMMPSAITRCLDAVDRGLLRACPGAKNWCRYVVLTLPRE